MKYVRSIEVEHPGMDVITLTNGAEIVIDADGGDILRVGVYEVNKRMIHETSAWVTLARSGRTTTNEDRIRTILNTPIWTFRVQDDPDAIPLAALDVRAFDLVGVDPDAALDLDGIDPTDHVIIERATLEAFRLLDAGAIAFKESSITFECDETITDLFRELATLSE